MRDVSSGWALRYCHANGAAFFFILIYAHMARGIYYGSYKSPRVAVWIIGVIIFLVLIITGFMGYVLPMGQMSLWGATVITNLMSAIPYIGQDIVESKENINIELLLPTFGIITDYVIKLKKIKEEIKKESINIPKGFLEMFVGFIDGDGYIHVGRTTKGYIRIKIVINLHMKDYSTLEYFKEILKIGHLTIYKSRGETYARYIISKTDIQYILIPLLEHHGLYFLTKNRSIQYNKILYILKNNIKIYSNIPTEIPIIKSLPITKEDYLNIPFLKNWLVGFTMADGTFIIKNNKDACYQITQKVDIPLFEALYLLLNNNTKKIYLHTGNKYGILNLSSIKDIQEVINFFSFNGNYPLIGSKLIQYEKWIKYLKESYRYKDLNFPNI